MQGIAIHLVLHTNTYLLLYNHVDSRDSPKLKQLKSQICQQSTNTCFGSESSKMELCTGMFPTFQCLLLARGGGAKFKTELLPDISLGFPNGPHLRQAAKEPTAVMNVHKPATKTPTNDKLCLLHCVCSLSVCISVGYLSRGRLM